MRGKVGSPKLLFENLDLTPIHSILWKGLHRQGPGKPVVYNPVWDLRALMLRQILQIPYIKDLVKRLRRGLYLGCICGYCDRAAPDHFVVIVPCGGHVTVVNSKLMKLAGITKDTPAPPGGQVLKDPKTGEPNGIFLDIATKLFTNFIPKPSPDDVKQGVKKAFALFSKYGVTSYMDAGFASYQKGMWSSGFRTYQEIYASGEQPVRAYISLRSSGRIRPKDKRSLEDVVLDEPVEQMMLPLTGFGNDWLKIGPFKLFTDGAEDSRGLKVFSFVAEQTSSQTL